MRTKNRIMAVGLVLAVTATVLVSADPSDHPGLSRDTSASPSATPSDTVSVPDGLVPAGPETPAAPTPELDLDLAGPVRGPDAVAALGDDLARLAEARGLLTADLAAAFDDPTLGVTPDGTLFYAEDHDAAQVAAGADHDHAGQGDEASVAAAAVAPLSQTFTLQSKPGSSRTIFLDFDGHTVSGTQWNTQFGVASGFHVGYSLDGDYGTFTDEERRFVQDVWQRVAEDYAPFDVNVTTQDPGLAALVRSGATDNAYGTRALITNSASFPADCGSGCAGIAFVGTATSVGERFHPAWIKGNVNARNPAGMALVVSHEVGHTFGLGHAGTTSSAYYAGHDNWGPIMGSPYSRALTQWTDHTYAGATRSSAQSGDDLAVLAATGLTVRADEAPGGVTDAPPVTPTGTEGVISTRTDADTWSLGTCDGRLLVEARSKWDGTNLDIRLDLLDAVGTTLTTSDPASGQTGSPPTATGTSATIDVRSGGAARWLRVDGTGRAPAYSDYGSLGAYVLTVTCDGSDGPPAATLAPGLVQVPGAPEVWLVTATSRHWIGAYAEYVALQRGLGDLRQVSAASLAAVPVGAPATRVVTDERDLTVWAVQTDGTRNLLAPGLAADLGFDPSALPALAGSQIQRYTVAAPAGSFYVTEGDPRVFLRTPGERHHVTTWAALQAAQRSRAESTITRLPAGAGSRLPVTSAVLLPMSLVRDAGGDAVRLAIDEFRLVHVPSFGLARDAGAGAYEVLPAGTISRNPVVSGSLSPFLTCGSTSFVVSGGSLVQLSGGSGGVTALALPGDGCGAFTRSGSVAAPVFVQTPGRSEVYVVEQGALHHVRSYEQLVRLNGSRPLTLLSWSGETVAGVGVGGPYLAGTFVQFAGDASVYRGDGRQLQHVTSFEALLRLGGGRVPPIETLPSSVRSFYTVSTPIS